MGRGSESVLESDDSDESVKSVKEQAALLFLRVTPLRGFPGGADGAESACQFRRPRRRGSIPGLGRFPEGGNGDPLQ